MKRSERLYSPESLRRRTVMLPLAVVLLATTAFLQKVIDPTAAKYHEGEGNLSLASSGLNNEFLLLPLLGFREAAAGLLWVRCDEFFHSGDYDAILPLVRLITWLDPHADNVYVTGAWHLSYNFTDSSERSDRRYISPSQALLDEGIRNNPNIPDIKFEKGWENFDKIKDFPTAETAFKSAIAGPHGNGLYPEGDMEEPPYAAPLKTLHILAHTYEKEGRIPEALHEWQLAMERSAVEMVSSKSPKDKASSARQLREAEKHNYAITLQRYYDRYTTGRHSDINPSNYPAILRPDVGSNTPRPWDVAFHPVEGKSAFIEMVRPRVFKISGRINTADGARVDVRITDWDYKERPVATAINSFDIDMSQTILVDSISVRKDKFEREMDMSKDPKMYSFSEPYYKVVLFYNCRITSPHLQDRFGWSGEGITDNDPARVIYDTNPLLRSTKLIEGQGGEGPLWDGKTIPWDPVGQPPRLIKITYKISKEQVLNQRPITDKDIVPNQ